MGFNAKITLFCDGCNNKGFSNTEHRKGHLKSAVWDLEDEIAHKGWLILSRGRYNTQSHYCPSCADKPMKPIPKKRKPVKSETNEKD